MNANWLWVLVGGIFETGWATCMKLSETFTVIPWTIACLALMPVSVIFLNKGLKSGLPMGPCYAVWVGIGAIGSIAVGLALFGEMLNLLGWAFLAVIVAGIIGLNMVTEAENPPEDGDGS